MSYVSTKQSSPESDDYEIYVVHTDGSHQFVGSGLYVAMYDARHIIYSNSKGRAFIVIGS